jgi:hypothetical protein
MCDCKNYFVCVIAKTVGYFVIAKKNWTSVFATIFRAWLQPEKLSVVAKPDCVCVVGATWLFGEWLQAWVVCDCKRQQVRLWLQKLFCVCHWKNCWIFYDWKKEEPNSVCDCNYFACVIATRSYLWLQNLTVSVWLKGTWLFGYLWLQDSVLHPLFCEFSESKKLKCFFIRLWCRKAGQTREDRDGDIEKLFQFFRECKQNNEAFYWDVDFDPKTKVLRSIFLEPCKSACGIHGLRRCHHFWHYPQN